MKLLVITLTLIVFVALPLIGGRDVVEVLILNGFLGFGLVLVWAFARKSLV